MVKAKYSSISRIERERDLADIEHDWVDDLTEAEVVAFAAYIGESLSKEDVSYFSKEFGHNIGVVGLIRAVQQGKKLSRDHEKYQVMGDVIERVILRREDSYGILYRGIKMPQKDVSKYVEGYVFDQGGTSSWSKSLTMSATFASRRDISGIPAIFVSVNGKHAADLGSMNATESEWQIGRAHV